MDITLTKNQAKQIASYIYDNLDEYINSNLEAFNDFLNKKKRNGETKSNDKLVKLEKQLGLEHKKENSQGDVYE